MRWTVHGERTLYSSPWVSLALADDERAVAVYRARGSRPDGREIDIEQILLCRVSDGRFVEVVAVPTDQRAFDAFWG